jgi:segregation and condensation protein B
MAAMDRTGVPSEQALAAEVLGEQDTLARELRERRQLLGWSQVELSRVAQVGRTVINQIEAGTRMPSLRTYAKLRAALGLEPPPAAAIPRRLPLQLSDDLVTALCAGLVARTRVPLAGLASALDVSIAAVRENLERVAARLQPAGYTCTEDGGEVRCWPLPGRATEVVRCLTVTEETASPSAEQLAVLAIVAFFGQVTRAEIEAFRGGGAAPVESASLLERMVAQGLVAKVRSDRRLGAPNVYTVTTKALRAAGYPTVEAMREVIAAQFTAAELAGIANAFERDRDRMTRGFTTSVQ